MNNAIASISTWPSYDLFDANADGLLDAWQTRYFGSPDSPNASPLADPDADGANNQSEFINQTDPTTSTSVAKLRPSLDQQGNGLLEWFAARSRLYTVESTTNLALPDWQAIAHATDLVGGNTLKRITNSFPGTRFYRLRTRLQRP